MKKKKSYSQPYVELALSVLVAFALSTTIAIILAFIATSMGYFTQEISIWINTVSTLAAGLIVGYQLNVLLTVHGKTKGKK
mgnify:CR=1 FL=1